MASPQHRDLEISRGDVPPARGRPLSSRKRMGKAEQGSILGILFQVQAALGRAFAAAAPGIHAPDLNLAIHEVITGALLARVLCSRGFLPDLPPGSGPDDLFALLEQAGEVVHLPVTGTSLSLPEVPIGRYPLPLLLQGDGYAAVSPLFDLPALQFAEIPPESWAGTLSALLSRRVYLTDGYKAEVMERQAIRSAGGYAPVHPNLADYLVRAGLEPLDTGETGLPRVLDPCCGGGPLLLAAFRALSRGIPPTLPAERAFLLQEAISGIDSDPRAVLSTRFVLLLALIEGAEPRMLPQQPGWHGLTRAVRWGNVLVEPETYKMVRASALDGVEAYLVCPLARDEILSRTPARRGFDLVLANPPSAGLSRHPPLREYFTMQYATSHEMDDPTPLFIERSLELLRPAGVLAAVTGRGWLRSSWGEPLRALLSRTCLREIDEILPGPGGAVPSGGYLVLVARKTAPGPEIRTARITDTGGEDLSTAIPGAARNLPSGAFGPGGWSLADRRASQLAAAIRTGSRPLAEILMGRIAEGTADVLSLPDSSQASRLSLVYPEDITPFRVGRQYIPPERGVSSPAGQRIFLAAPGGRIAAGFALPGLQPGPGVIATGSRDPFLLAVLNSPIATFCHRNLPQGSGEGLVPLTVRSAGRLPVPPIDFDDPGAAASHSRASRTAFALATGNPPPENTIQDGTRAIMQDLARLYGLREHDLTVISDG